MAGDYATREWPWHQREAVTKNTAAAVTKNRGRPFTGKAKTVAEHARKHRAAKRGKGAALKQSRDKAVTARGKDQSDGNGSDGNGKHRVSRGSLPYAS